jgi:hypothetical protein
MARDFLVYVTTRTAMLLPLLFASVALNGYWSAEVIGGAAGLVALFWATVWAVHRGGSHILRRFRPQDPPAREG